jgi:hypothetical protein
MPRRKPVGKSREVVVKNGAERQWSAWRRRPESEKFVDRCWQEFREMARSQGGVMGARIEWVNVRGKPVEPLPDWSAKCGDVRLHFLGIRNTGDRPLVNLIVRATVRPGGWATTWTTFKHPGRQQRFAPVLRLGDLKVGKRAMFWVRYRAMGIEGPGPILVAEETPVRRRGKRGGNMPRLKPRKRAVKNGTGKNGGKAAGKRKVEPVYRGTYVGTGKREGPMIHVPVPFSAVFISRRKSRRTT